MELINPSADLQTELIPAKFLVRRKQVSNTDMYEYTMWIPMDVDGVYAWQGFFMDEWWSRVGSRKILLEELDGKSLPERESIWSSHINEQSNRVLQAVKATFQDSMEEVELNNGALIAKVIEKKTPCNRIIYNFGELKNVY